MKKMALLVGFMLVWGVWAGCNVAYAECYSVNNNTLLLPCVEFQGTIYKVTFNAYQEPSDPSGTYWKLNLSDVGPSDVPDSGECGSLDYFDTWVFTVPCNDGTFELHLYRYDVSGYYLKQIGIDNVAVPSSVEANQEFSISFSYNHSGGVNDIKEIQIWMSDSPNAPTETFTLNGTGNGSFTRDGYWFNQSFTGNQWIEIWIIDSLGRICKKRIIIIVRCSVCTNSCTNNNLPYIVNGKMSVNNQTVMNNQQASVEVSKAFNISFSYNDPDGLNNVKEIHLKMSDENIDYSYNPDSSGIFTIGGTFLPPYTGNQWIEVWVVDSCGRRCEVIRIIIIVTVPSCNNSDGVGCYPIPSCNGGIRGVLKCRVVYCIRPPCPYGGCYIHKDDGSDVSAVLYTGVSNPPDGKNCCFKGYYDYSGKYNITSYSDCR